MMQAVRAHIPHIRSKAKKPETLSRKDANVVHFCDFREAQKLPTIIKDASLPSVQQELMEYISYESCIHKIKGSSIGPKLSSIDNWHVKNGYEPPFMVAFTAKDFFDDVKALDAAACPKIPVPAQCIELMVLRKVLLRQEPDRLPSARSLYDDLVECTAASTGLWLLLRSIEYLQQDPKKKFVGLTWGDVTFKNANRDELVGDEVTLDSVQAETSSLISTKNSFGRCTRTLAANADNVACPVRLKVQLYRLTTEMLGHPPPADRPVFSYEDGSIMSRSRMSELLRGFVGACGIDTTLVASHSLRRGGCVVYHSNQVPLDTIKRFGRWNSDAVLLYIHDTDSEKTIQMANCFRKVPKFELH